MHGDQGRDPDPSLHPRIGSAWTAEGDPRRADEPIWRLDPTELALTASTWRAADEYPLSFCPEVGRRLLLAQLQFSEWILRRVVKASFEHDRSVLRRITMEFMIPRHAPIFTDHQGRLLRLVPLSIMNRRTLVNLDLRDEVGEALTMPGMRLTQQLDQSILLAAAAAKLSLPGVTPDIRTFIQHAVAGPISLVADAFKLFDSDRSHDIAPLRADPLFLAAFDRLRHKFTLYVFLDESKGQHRLIRMSFDEPTNWHYQVPELVETSIAPKEWTYTPGERPKRQLWLAMLGLKATRVRFQAPGAENAASYHFEVDAPEGIQVVSATLLAGRPNEPARYSWDRIVGHSPTVGLHAVEVPNGSLSRVQVDLRVPTRGWLSTMVVATFTILAVLALAALPWWSRDPNWSEDEVTNIVVLLVTASAAVATLVAQRDFGGVAARFATGVRALGTTAIALPLVAAGVLIYGAPTPDLDENTFERLALLSIFGVASVPFLLIGLAWILSWQSERGSIIEESPWDMTEAALRRAGKGSNGRVTAPTPPDFNTQVQKYQFDSPAIGIHSAEGWHTRYAWTDEAQRSSISGLETQCWWQPPRGVAAGCTEYGRACSSWDGCPGRRLESASAGVT